MKPIRVLLADDHTLVRAGMRSLIGGLGGFEVVAEAGDGQEALRLIEQHRPDIVLLDISMPGMVGTEVASRAARASPGTRVIILSMNAAEEYVLQALRAGAAGYLLKASDTVELELALKAVSRGETYLSPAVSKHVVADYVRRVGGAIPETSSLERLTPRQREVLQLIAEGNSTKEIARTLGISVKTAETHRSQLMDQLDIHDVAGLVRYAIRSGLIAPEP
jgi:DNA-binding NarL/FixJ family response regulator